MKSQFSTEEASFRILGVDHIAAVPRDFEVSLRFFSEILELRITGSEEVEHQNTAVTMLSAASLPSSSQKTTIELLQATSKKGVIARYLEKKGGGIHHIALRVDDIHKAWQALKQRGAELVGEAPGKGAGGTQVFFVHPRCAGGILLEFVEHPHEL